MKTKKIIADTMPLALKKVRQELGDNAIIVNTRVVKVGGLFGFFSKQKYEVTAYSMEKERLWQNETSELVGNEKFNSLKELEKDRIAVTPKQPQKLYPYSTEQPAMPSQSPSSASKPLGNDNLMLDELQHLRKMMVNFIATGNQGKALPPGLTKTINRLKKQGVDEEVVEYIISTLLKKQPLLTDFEEAEINRSVIAVITELIENKVPTSHGVDQRTRIINVIGPTGVGKTTTIAKLATEQVLKQKRRVAMITTDVYRIAAVEQLKTYAVILNVPIEVVRTSDELDRAFDNLKHYDLIYMDTTGRNYKEAKNRETINEFLYHPPESDNYLVLSLTTKFEDLQILLDEFLNSPVQKLILTKLDETSSYGSILNIAYHYHYQLAYITHGQSVPEDISTVDAAHIARTLVGEEN